MKKINEIKGLENVLDIYFISKEGYVYSSKLKGKLSEWDNGKGYKVVSLKIKNQRKWKKAYIHRLVALAYLENENNYEQVNHKDENKSNNNISNLEWCNHIYNNNYGTKNQRMVENRCDYVYVYDYLLNFVGKYLGLSEATRQTIGRVESRALNSRLINFFYLDSEMDINNIIEISNNSKYKTVVVENINDGNKLYFPTNREARRFFDNKVNVTDAIKKNWLVKKTYKIYELDYSKLKDSPNLQELQLQEVGDKEPLR